MDPELKKIGPYEIQDVIGSGGMGVVYRAVQPALKRFVAIKILPANLARNKEFVERFLREARSVAALDHPSIVTIYDIGQSEGAYYFVMKFLVGDTLDEYIEEEGRLPLDRALLFAGQLADALGTAHESGVIHRDVKPANIIVDPREKKVVLTDFGIALTLEETRLTRPGTMFGSPIYIAPEQLEGDDVDHRADFYSLGSVLYQMLAGQPPYEADMPMAILHQRIKDPEKSVREINPEVPRAVDRLVMRMMARNPDDRPQTAAEVLEALRVVGEQPDEPLSVDEPLVVTPPEEEPPAYEPPPTVAVGGLELPTETGETVLPLEPVEELPAADAVHGAPRPGLAKRFGVRRIILAWIGAMAILLAVLLVVVWWNRDTGPVTLEEGQQSARLIPPGDGEEAAGETAVDEAVGEAGEIAGDIGDTPAGTEKSLPEKSAEKETGLPAGKAVRTTEPAAVGGKPALAEVEDESAKGERAVRPTEVTSQEPAQQKEVEQPPVSAPVQTIPEVISEAEVTEQEPDLPVIGKENVTEGEENETVAESTPDEALADEAELAGLATRIDRGVTAGTVEGLEDAGQALTRFRELAPEDSRLERHTTLFDDAEKRLWQSRGITRGFSIGPGVEMEFVWVPPGTFRMGTVTQKKSTHTAEGPKHTVVISQGFWLGTYEVTQAQWEKVMGRNPSNFKGADRPVDRISWNDAQAFVAKLNSSAGAGRFRLPTEAEWEYVCRAGTARSFFGGEINTVGCKYEAHLAPWAWYCHNSEDRTHPVGSRKPNAWGFYDMHGNVGEWCSDYYDRNYYEYSAIRNPRGPDKGKTRVLRGGGWDFRAWDCRSAYRGNYRPTANNNSFGLRLVRTRTAD